MTTSENTEVVRARVAIVEGHADSLHVIKAYLPTRYDAVISGRDVLIFGTDNGGWTLEGYVIPRLASGMYFARELK